MSWLGDKFDSITEVASSAVDSIKDAAVSAGRVYIAGTQGLVMGVGGGIASIADFAVNSVVNVGYDWTTRHAINLFRENDLESVSVDMSGSLVGAIKEHGLQPQNDAERWAMAGGQAVGEIGVVVGATILTAGVGGAIAGGELTTARATAIGSKVSSISSAIANTGASATINASRFGTTAQSVAATVMEAGGTGIKIGEVITSAGSKASLVSRLSQGMNTGSTLGWGIANPIQLSGNFNRAMTVAEGGFLGFAAYTGYNALNAESTLLEEMTALNSSNRSINSDSLQSVRELDDYLTEEYKSLSGSELVGDEYQTQYEKLNRIADISTELSNNELYGHLKEEDINSLVQGLKEEGINLDLRTASEKYNLPSLAVTKTAELIPAH